jgi:hypothetical protein
VQSLSGWPGAAKRRWSVQAIPARGRGSLSVHREDSGSGAGSKAAHLARSRERSFVATVDVDWSSSRQGGSSLRHARRDRFKVVTRQIGAPGAPLNARPAPRGVRDAPYLIPGMLLRGRRWRCRRTCIAASSAARPSSRSRPSPRTGRPGRRVQSAAATRSRAFRPRSWR